MLAPILADDGRGMKTLMLVMAMPATVGALLVQTALHDKPPTPPSASAAEKTDSFYHGLQRVSKNKAYRYLLLAFGCGVGVFNAVTTLMAQIVAPNGYNDDDASIFAACLIGAGLVGAGVAGAVLDKTKAFLPMIRITFIAATASFIFFALVNKESHKAQLAIASGVMGMFCFAVLPIALELGVECTFPVSEGTSAGFMWISGQFFGTIFILLMEYPLLGQERWVNTTNATDNSTTGKKYPDMQNSCWFLVGVGAFASIMLLLMRTEYRRQAFDAQSDSNARA